MLNIKKRVLSSLLALFVLLPMLGGIIAHADAGHLTNLEIMPDVGFVFDPENDSYIVNITANFMLIKPTCYDAEVYIQDITGGDTPYNQSDKVESGSWWVKSNIVVGNSYTLRVTVVPTNTDPTEIYTITLAQADHYYLTQLLARSPSGTTYFNHFNPEDNANFGYEFAVDYGVNMLEISPFISATAGSKFTVTSDNTEDASLNDTPPEYEFDGTQNTVLVELKKNGVYAMTTVVTITVTPDDTAEHPPRVYTLTVNRGAFTSVPDAQNAFLVELGLRKGAANGDVLDYLPGFSKTEEDYAATVEYETESVTISVVPQQLEAIPTINGEVYGGGGALIREGVYEYLGQSQILVYYRYTLEGIPLTADTVNSIPVVVTAENKITQKTYTVAVQRKADDPNRHVATLDVLTVNNPAAGANYALTPVFDSDTKDYTAVLQPPGGKMTISALPTNPNATIAGIGIGADTYENGEEIPAEKLTAGTVINIVVASEAGSDYEVYRITMQDPPDLTPPTLSLVSVPTDTLTKQTATLKFDTTESGTYFYSIRESGADAPDENEILLDNQSGAASVGTNYATVPISTLTENTAYKIYVLEKDDAGNASAILSVNFTTVYLPIINVLITTGYGPYAYVDQSLYFSFNANMAGTYYMVVTEEMSVFATLTADQVKDPSLISGHTIYASDSAPMVAGENTAGPDAVAKGIKYTLNTELPANSHVSLHIYGVGETGQETAVVKKSSVTVNAMPKPQLTGTVELQNPKGEPLTGPNAVAPKIGEDIVVVVNGNQPDAALRYGFVRSGSSTYTYNTTGTLLGSVVTAANGYLGQTVEALIVDNSGNYSGSLTLRTVYPVEKLSPPAAPAAVGVNATEGVANASINGLTPGKRYNYSSNGGIIWTTKEANGSGRIIGLQSGVYLIREEVDLTVYSGYAATATVVLKENSNRTPVGREPALAVAGVNAGTKTLGSITGLTEGRAYLYKAASASDYIVFTPTAGTPNITNLPAGNYKLRYQDTDTYAYTQEDTVTISPSVPWNDGTLTLQPGVETITVNFTPPFDGGAPITRYKVTVSSGDFGEDLVDEIEIFMPVNDTETLFDQLDPTVEYTVRVYAYNGLGSGDGYGAPWEAKETPNSTPPAPPPPPPPSSSPDTPDEPDAPSSPKEYRAYLTGYENNLFGPRENVTRAQAAVMLVRVLLGITDIPATYVPSFSDVPSGAWYANAVGYMEHLGIMQGYDGKFRPNESITREEFTKIVVLTAVRLGLIDSVEIGTPTFTDTADISPWAMNYAYTAQLNGYYAGDENGRLLPKGYLERASAASVLNAMLGRKITRENLDGFGFRKFADVSENDLAFLDIVAATSDYRLTADGNMEPPGIE
jgi:hypothetical protein